MIKVIDGDLFTTGAKFICHQVNCQGQMNSGVALQIKQKYPHVYEEYVKALQNAPCDMLGKIQVVPIKPEYLGYDCGTIAISYTEQWICNMFAQDKYGYDGKMYTSLEALQNCFTQLYWLTCEKNNNFNAKIAMPYRIGCVRGGADWNVVYKMIEDTFVNREVELWRYNKG
uniref:macro domain-containing protein n=1 Tax=Coprococcus catus TaxID=116085 RepID=UPI0022E7E853|nr:macro domain-containing protein [Coprococcus catus]